MTYDEFARVCRVAQRWENNEDTEMRLLTRHSLFEASLVYWGERGDPYQSPLWNKRTPEDIEFAGDLALRGHVPHDHHLSGRAKAY